MTAIHPAVERADALIDLRRYDEASALLAQRIAEDPADVRAWAKLSRCHLDAGRPDEALAAADEALKLDPQDVGGLLMRSYALRAVGGARMPEVEAVLREVVRLAPQYWLGHALLADVVFITNIVSRGQANGGQVTPQDMDVSARLAEVHVKEALRLGPEEVYGYEVAYKIASLAGNETVADELDLAILQLDPNHPQALERQTRKAADTPGVKAVEAADLYAAGLAAAPDSEELRRGLDHATYRMLRGVRWLALLCLGLGASMIDLFAVDGETQRALPVELGQRLWCLVPMSAIWAVGALLRYRRRRTGVQLNVQSLLRRGRWARIVVAQAAWAMLCTLVITQVPWTDRAVPTVVFWAGLVPTFATVWFDRRKTG